MGSCADLGAGGPSIKAEAEHPVGEERTSAEDEGSPSRGALNDTSGHEPPLANGNDRPTDQDRCHHRAK